jgi:hypothetical protein
MCQISRGKWGMIVIHQHAPNTVHRLLQYRKIVGKLTDIELLDALVRGTVANTDVGYDPVMALLRNETLRRLACRQGPTAA